jgi:protein phosphatase
MAWRAALDGVPWQTVLRRCGIVFAAAQVVNAVRGVGISRVLRRKLRRARHASTRRKRAAEARQAQKQAEKRAATQRARAEADAKSARKRTRAPLRADDSGPESNRFGVAHSRDGPRDSKWLAGEYEENVPVHVEREIAAAALDEVAMALAAEGDTDASAAVAGMALRVAAAESPKKIRLEALANLSSTLSSNLGSNRLVATERVGEDSTTGATDRFGRHGERASASPSRDAASRAGPDPFSFRNDASIATSAPSGSRRGALAVSSASSADRGKERRARSDGSPSPESFAASAFEMAARAAAMGDDPEGLTSDEEAEEVEFAERRRASAAAAAAAAEAERRHAAGEAALAAAAAAGATAARRASFDEWAAASASREGVSTGAADDAASVSSYHGSLDDYSSDSGSDVSDVEAATGAASAWLAKTRARMRLSPTKSGGSFFSPSRRRAGDATETDGKDERDADDARETRTTGKNGEDGFLFDRANVTVDLAPERPERSGVTASPIGREAERRARESASSAEDGGGAPRAPSPSAPPTLRLEVLSGVSRGDAVSAPPGVELLTVGRGDARDLCVGDVEVSSSHAEFRWTWFTAFPAGDAGAADAGAGAGADALFGADDAGRARLGEWRVADVGSTNGTFLNGDAVHGSGGRGRNANPWRALRHGDEIRLGERAESPALRVSLVHETDPTRARDANTTANTANTASHGVHERSHVRAFEPCLFLRSSARVDPGKPPRMEDRSLSECPLRGCVDVALFAVFDGHAGADAAERARRVFPEVLAKRLGHCAPRGHGDAPGDAANALRDAFLETDANIACEYEGCSAAVLLVWRCDATGGVYAQTANVGDAGHRSRKNAWSHCIRRACESRCASRDARARAGGPRRARALRRRRRERRGRYQRNSQRFARLALGGRRVSQARAPGFGRDAVRLRADFHERRRERRRRPGDARAVARRGRARGGGGGDVVSGRRGKKQKRPATVGARGGRGAPGGAGAPAQVQGGRRGGGRAAGAGDGHRGERGVSNARVRRSRRRRVARRVRVSKINIS